jgi:hypothetical protein
MSEPEPDQVHPVDFVRAVLGISPEDAEKVRERTPGTRPERQEQEGPSADYGDER